MIIMKKIPPRLLIIIAVFLSLLAAFLTYSMLKKGSGTKQQQAASTKQVVVAKDAIGADTVIQEGMLKVVEMPSTAAQPDAFKEMKDVVGKKTTQPINPGDQLTRRRFSAAQNTGLQVSIPKDKRAVTIAVNEVTSIAGFVKPGQYVDVINVVAKQNAKPAMGKMILQNVLVLGTGARDMSTAGSNRAEKVGTVTLAVDPRDAVKLRVAQQEGGTISLALRPLKPEEENVAGTLVVGSGAAEMPPVGDVPQAMPAGPAKPAITVIRGTGVGAAPAAAATVK